MGLHIRPLPGREIRDFYFVVVNANRTEKMCMWVSRREGMVDRICVHVAFMTTKGVCVHLCPGCLRWCKGYDVPTCVHVVWVEGGKFLDGVCTSTKGSDQISVHVVTVS